jgi:hypothetical protein
MSEEIVKEIIEEKVENWKVEDLCALSLFAILFAYFINPLLAVLLEAAEIIATVIYFNKKIAELSMRERALRIFSTTATSVLARGEQNNE